MSKFKVYEDQLSNGTWYVTIYKDNWPLDTGKGDTLEAARQDALTTFSLDDLIEFEAWYHIRDRALKVVAVLIGASIPVLCVFYLGWQWLTGR